MANAGNDALNLAKWTSEPLASSSQIELTREQEPSRTRRTAPGEVVHLDIAGAVDGSDREAVGISTRSTRHGSPTPNIWAYNSRSCISRA